MPGPADHLANERTFLAWIRTSIALMGFGFVIVKFALFIKQISLVLGSKASSAWQRVFSYRWRYYGCLGAVIALLAFVRYSTIEKQLNNNGYAPSKLLSILLTAGILIGSIFLVVYLVPSIR